MFVNFIVKEIQLLNQRLKFRLWTFQSEVDEVITGIEYSIQWLNEPQKDFRKKAYKLVILENLKSNKISCYYDYLKIIKSLQTKECFY